MKSVCILISGLLLSACTTSYERVDPYTGQAYSYNRTQRLNDSSSYAYNEILIVNQSRELISDVHITSGSSGRSFSCDNIAPRGICSDRFPSRPYHRNPIQISWTFAGLTRQTKEFVLEVPTSFDPAIPVRGVLLISEAGEIRTFFEQGDSY